MMCKEVALRHTFGMRMLQYSISIWLQDPATIATITSTGGRMSFTLDLGDPGLVGVDGAFAMDVVGPGNTILGSVSLSGSTFFDGPSQDVGSIAGPRSPRSICLFHCS